jgi:hypothetical protein
MTAMMRFVVCRALTEAHAPRKDFLQIRPAAACRIDTAGAYTESVCV